MNRERRKEVAKVFFDLSKYLLTTIVVGSFIAKDLKVLDVIIAAGTSFCILVIAYFITPKDKI